jgi:pyrroline-5-carboxylate reductase
MIANNRIGFIGGGNMTRNLIGGMIAADFNAANIVVSNRGMEKLRRLESDFKITTTQDNLIAADADVIILAVKPQQFFAVVSQLKNLVQKKQPLIISIAAGISLTQLKKWLGNYARVVRTMPNLPSKVGLGMTGLCADAISADDKLIVENIFNAVGKSVWLKSEQQLDILSAIAGSGPAMIFLLAELLESSGVKLGLSAEQTKVMTKQMILGAATMLNQEPFSAEELRRQVTSPKGTTEKEIETLLQADFEDTLFAALSAAINRAKELSVELEQ